MLEHNPLCFVSRFDLEFDGNLILNFILAPDINLEFVDGNIFAHYRFYVTRIDVRASDELHIVPATPDAAAVEIPGAPAIAGAGRYLHDHIPGAIADKGDEAAPEGGHDAFS